MNTGKRNTARKVLCLVLAVLIPRLAGLRRTHYDSRRRELEGSEKELVALREEQAELKKQK